MRTARRTATTAIAVSVALSAGLTLSGCAPTSPAPDDVASARLEQTVLVITQAIAVNDWVAADRDLGVLEAHVEAALAAGEITEERATAIRAAIALVRADVAMGIEQSQPVESPEPTDTENSDDEESNGEESNGESGRESDKPGNRGGNSGRNDD